MVMASLIVISRRIERMLTTAYLLFPFPSQTPPCLLYIHLYIPPHYSTQMDGDSTQKPNSPIMCANGCGFFGNPLTSNLCSKCYRDSQARQKDLAEPAVKPTPEPVATAPAPDPTPSTLPSSPSTPASIPTEPTQGDEPRKTQADTTRCFSCNKKVGLLGFKCRCDYVYCSLHRYSDKHSCSFDYKAMARANLQKANPVVQASKVEKI
jgi:hypothetical protein